MSRVSTYLNFAGNCEEAFEFYKSVFGTDYLDPIMRMSDVPPDPNGPQIPDAEQRMVMHASLPILGGHIIHGTDMIESMGHQLRVGNNTTLNLEPDTRAETERLFAALSDGATDINPLTQMFWGSYWGTCLDRFSVRWMFNCAEPAA